MAVNRTETAKKFLAKEIEKLSEQERQVVERFIQRGRIARNVAHEFEEQLTVGQRLADHVAEIIGSWWKEETKMSKARLIKHREWLEREQVAQRQARLSSVAQVEVDAVRNWVKRQQASQRPNAREMFAALFVQRPTS